jgi:hypothetical protein
MKKGICHPIFDPDDLPVNALVQSLCEWLRPEVTTRAQTLAGRMSCMGRELPLRLSSLDSG